MNFIRYIDDLRNEYVLSMNINDYYNFYFYKNIKVVGEYNIENEILVLKRFRAAILIRCKESGIKLYLSDFDIIDIIVNLINEHTQYGMDLISRMEKLISGEGSKIIFMIEDKKEEKEFELNGINFIDENIKINTHADIVININEFILVMNLILEKERVSGDEVVEGTLGKYILLSKYYSNAYLEEYNLEDILKEYGIDTNESLEYNKYNINKKSKNTSSDAKLLIPYKKLIQENIG
ncbi:MAG: hypothetical protein ACLT0R_09280 [Paraclostridium sordellii]|nr:hypothetical protein [Paeniclostridium sordellii]